MAMKERATWQRGKTMNALKAEAQRYANMYRSAKRRADQDVAAGRQPSKDDMARMERYASLGFKAIEAVWSLDESGATSMTEAFSFAFAA